MATPPAPGHARPAARPGARAGHVAFAGSGLIVSGATSPISPPSRSAAAFRTAAPTRAARHRADSGRSLGALALPITLKGSST